MGGLLRHGLLARCDTSVHLSSALTRALGDWVYDQVSSPCSQSFEATAASHLLLARRLTTGMAVQFVNLNILIKATRRFLRLPYWSLAAHVNGNVRPVCACIRLLLCKMACT